MTPRQWWRRSRLWQKLVGCFVLLIILCLGTMYGIARWYIAQQSSQPLTLGVSFIPDYASYLGLNPEKTLEALIDQLGVRHFRFTSYWTDIEPTEGSYNFSQLDWEFKLADESHSTVILSIGARQPRWPECHIPSWAASEPESVWYPQLTAFMTAVVNRYKDNPALQSYQLENEYFLKAFGECTNYSRQRLVNEYGLVKKLDPNHPVIISRSNNAIGLPIGQPTPDEFGINVYKRIFDDIITHRYFEYPIPAWYYGFLAGAEELISGKNTFIPELQAEPWPPVGESVISASIAEQNKSMNAAILQSRINYGEATGMRSIYLWGAEWWYWRLEKANDPSLWNVAKQAFAEASANHVTPPAKNAAYAHPSLQLAALVNLRR